MLDEIKNVLTALADNKDYPMEGVYYGICTAQELPKWNYFVFNRTKVESSHHSYTWVYEVHIIHENYIMEDYDLTVVKALKEAIPGLSLYDDATYDYVQKGNTDIVVEICTLAFKKARKAEDGR